MLKRIIFTVLAVYLVLMILLAPVGYAWLSDNGMSSFLGVTGHVHKSYFESGDGSPEAPFEIARPVQLYYFAWLQNLGYFNEDNDGDGGVDTVYFRISNDLDMNGFILPPIGTGEHPFLGNLDGEDHSIKNLQINNNNSILTDSPMSGELAGAEIIGFFGVIGEPPTGDNYLYEINSNEVKNFILENITVKTETNKALIGLVAGYVNGTVDSVGVVGSTVDIASGTEVLSFTESLSEYSVIGYCTEDYKKDVVIMNVELSDPTIREEILVKDNSSDGEGQGWGGTINMKKMFNRVQGVMKATNSAINGTTTATNRSYIYAREEIKDLAGNIEVLSTSTTEKRVYVNSQVGAFVFSPRSSGSYSEQYTYLSGGARVDSHTYRYGSEESVYYITDGEYYLTLNGTAVSLTNDAQAATKWFMSNGLSGGEITAVVNNRLYYLDMNGNSPAVYDSTLEDSIPSWEVRNGALIRNGGYLTFENGNIGLAVSGYKISSGNTYMTVNNSGALDDTTDEKSALVWSFSNGTSGVISAVASNGNTYYLRGQNNSLSVTTNANNATNWTYSNNRLSYSTSNGWWGSTTYYVRLNGSNWTITTNQGQAANITLTGGSDSVENAVSVVDSGEKLPSVIIEDEFKIDNSIDYAENGTTVETGITYFPIGVNTDGYTVSNGNTGYIVSSSYSKTKSTSLTYPYGTGDIRISYYTTSTNMTNYQDPYTISYKTGGKFTQIDLSSNNDAAKENEILQECGLVKYVSSYGGYYESVTSDRNCYGLHFMEASIDINSKVKVPVTILNRSEDSFELPTNCIDFNLAEPGFVNFFAGTYFGDNNSFFALHKIERNPDKTIKSIKEIELIYGYMKSDGYLDTTKHYFYKYVGESSVDLEGLCDALPSGYEVIFKTDWITDPKSYFSDRTFDKKAFYIEVPINAGEYALGSAEGKIGAYLVYLDLAANAQMIERVTTTEVMVSEKLTATIPDGVAIIENAAAHENMAPEDSAFVDIGAGFGENGGSVQFNRDENSITYNASDNTEAYYVGPGVTLTDGENKERTSEFKIVETVIVERVTMDDLNINTGETTLTVITTTVTLDASGNETSREVTATVNGANSTATDDRHKITVGNSVIRLEYVPDGATVTINYTYTPGTNNSAESYSITVTSDADVTVAACVLAEGYVANVNGVDLTLEETKISVSAP